MQRNARIVFTVPQTPKSNQPNEPEHHIQIPQIQMQTDQNQMQMDQVQSVQTTNSESLLMSQLQSATAMIESEAAQQHSKLVQDARVVALAIEEKRRQQHILTEHYKNQQLSATYLEFLLWVQQITGSPSLPTFDESTTTTTNSTCTGTITPILKSLQEKKVNEPPPNGGTQSAFDVQ